MDCKEFISGLHEEQCGQDTVEYALVLAAISAAIATGSNAVATIMSKGIIAILSKLQNILK